MPRTGVFGIFFLKVLIVISVLPLGSVRAAVYYIDQKNPAASDANEGTEAAPWLTLSPANRFQFSPGDIVLVKEGTYRVPAKTDKQLALINPLSSGKSGSPIVFKSSPAFAATLEGDRDLQAPVQIINQSHIAIEGFRIVNPGLHGILVRGDKNKAVDSIVLRNNIINDEQGAKAAIHVENANHTVIENNEINHAENGIRIVNNAIDTKIVKNIISNTAQAVHISGDASSTSRETQIANNVFAATEVGVSFVPEGGIIRKSFVNNNVFTDYSVAALQIVQPGMGKVDVWNNIFKRGKQDKSFIADVLTYDDPPLSLARMDYNVFTEQPLVITGLYSSNRRLSTLNVWREFAEQDAHSVVGIIEFKNPVKNDFRLAKRSRNILKGTTDGKPSSRRTEVGAYTAAIDKIGIIRPVVSEQVATAQPKAATVDKTANPAELASVGPIEGKPIVKTKTSKLEWELDRRLQFGGKCVLESNRIDFFDGHDNTGLTFRVLDDQLIMLTKSNIDMTFHDVGLQVGKNEFLHADSVMQDQNVVFSKEMPRLITQLRKSSETRVQLRFWPTYPATKAYSELVSLDGFLPAYESYKDCQRGN